MKIAKEFAWEMSHRLPFHKGPCKNIHGHSYKLRLTLEGKTNQEAMILDFYDMQQILMPLIDSLDHAFLCDKEDDLMINFLSENSFKHYIIENFSTCENLAEFFLDKLTLEFKRFDNIKKIGVRVYETIDAYSEMELEF